MKDAGTGIQIGDGVVGGVAERGIGIKVVKKRNIFILLCFALSVCLSMRSPESGIASAIPADDREVLESFFRTLITSGGFGYVMYGSKPMAAMAFDTATSQANTEENVLYKGWITWEKYRHLFPIEHYIFRLSQNPLCPSGYWVVLINKEKCRSCIADNLDLFQQIRGKKVTPEEILEELQGNTVIPTEVLGSNDCLLGILFGYGRHNSALFHKRKVMQANGLKADSIVLLPFNPLDRGTYLIDLPRFGADFSHPVSNQLRIEYEKSRQLITDLYQDEKFLERALTELYRR